MTQLRKSRKPKSRALPPRPRSRPKSRPKPGSKSATKPATKSRARKPGARKLSVREPKLLRKVLVANRGEIAIRVLRALRDMGIGSVAVFSEADRMSSHIMFADEAYCIGRSPARESYLNIPRILDLAKSTGCQAIHPGYGFLAENHEFARACEDSGIVFIGPTSQSIEAMGLKTAARKTMKASGVPVIPGSEGAVLDGKDVLGIASDIGYPVILKASAGGGGKGMRIVRNAAEMKQAFKTAADEARASFGRPDIFIEKYIQRPRHIEVQILADNYGNTIHLGERECSIQRRYQKLIEESPSPALSDKQRADLCKAALAAAKAADYRNAGTVEFLLDPSGRFYFLEMNTRLQVEHPVTELTTGIDIVKEQIRIASGFPLAVGQSDVKRSGSAIECRICAEDPRNDFMPSLGKIKRLRNPEGPWVRVENYIYEGYEVPVYYDPLIAKLITWGETRDEALTRMLRALEEYVIEGIETTIPFHIWVMRDRNFRRGNFNTAYIDEHYTAKAGGERRRVPVEIALIATAINHLALRPGPEPERAKKADKWKAASRQESTARWPHAKRRGR